MGTFGISQSAAFVHSLYGHSRRIDLSQENIADILTLNRVNVAKCLSRLRDEGIIVSHRKWIEVKNLDKLELYCSQETLNSDE